LLTTKHDKWVTESIIARWKLQHELQANVKWATFNITGDDVIKIPTPVTDTVLIWALAANKASAQIYLPSELRPV